MPINGPALATAGIASIFLYSAIKGKSVLASAQSIISGKSPATVPQSNPINDIAVGGSGASQGSAFPNAPALPIGDLGSNESVMKTVAASYGWTDANGQWPALVNVENAEASFNLTAKNPTSGAYGEAQFINGPSEYAQYGGDATTAQGQAVGMCNYIKQRYGSPIVAWAFHQANGWY